jgi:putative SOS response-associated peptidase YedK
VAKSNAFRSAFKHRRCLMPADGFFEWFPGPPKVPHYFQLASGEPFAFAGIWERWGESLETCALITTSANAVVGPVHHRMPVILHPVDYAPWLDPGTKPEELDAMLRPYDGPMTDTAVGPYVNSPRNRGPQCIEPAA